MSNDLTAMDKAIEAAARAVCAARQGTWRNGAVHMGGRVIDTDEWNNEHRYIARAAIAAYEAAREADGSVWVPVEVMNFLYGRGPLEGKWFGDRPPAGKGAYWWRPVIRAMIAARPKGEG